MRSIRSIITMITVLVILTSVLSVFGASYIIIQNETDQNSVRMMNLINEDTDKALEKYFGSVEQSAEIAANIAVEDLDSVVLVSCGAVKISGNENSQTPEQVEELDAYLETYCDKVQVLFSGVAENTEGVNSYYYCLSPEISKNVHGFFYTKEGKTGLIEQDPLDATNLTPEEHLGDTWYATAVKMGSPGWVGPYIFQNQWVYSYFVQIYKAGMLVGILGMDIPCDILVDQVRNISVYNTGFVCLLDKNANVIYHPELPINSSFDELHLSVTAETFKKENSGNELIRYLANGEKRQMSFSTLTTEMKVVCIAPTREINAPWTTLIKDIALITAFTILFFVIIILVVMRAITLPLTLLTNASKQLADGDYDVDLTYDRKNEIGALTTAFNRMRDQIKRNIENLNHQIYYDRLTDLPNMRYFFKLANKAKEQILESGHEPVMVYFDIIGIRYYNRRYGFKTGDKLILSFAKIISKHFGESRVCRFSGDHFTAVTEEDNVGEIIRKVLNDCETVFDGKELSVRVGVYPNRLDDVDVNVACDRAKFAADTKKGELASTVTYYDEKMLKQSELSVHIIQNIDRAIEEGWIKVYYQPIVRASNGSICDEEALARWIDPEMGFLSPAAFIPALEEYKLIYKLDLYVLEQVLKKMKMQKEKGYYVVAQSINLSRMDFESCDIVEEICKRVDAEGIDHSMISIEITESVIGENFEFMKEQVERFQKLGFPVWMDDFGSGYSSLDVLHQIHFDLIKLDMRFMERFDEGEEGKIIVTELVNMAMSLGMDTLCEGVEHPEQVEFLREIGCTRIQGFYYGKAIPFEDIVSRVETSSYIEYENPAEAEYYASIGRLNLYDLSSFSNENEDIMAKYFDTLPMCIMEVNGTKLWYSRCNRSYRDFLNRTLNVAYSTDARDVQDDQAVLGSTFFKAVIKCGQEGNRLVVDEKVGPDTVVHTLIRRIAVNPVTGNSAVAAAVLTISNESASGMARAR
jgi:diguanylate cyclase (GGDEF)-like protein